MRRPKIGGGGDYSPLKRVRSTLRRNTRDFRRQAASHDALPVVSLFLETQKKRSITMQNPMKKVSGRERFCRRCRVVTVFAAMCVLGVMADTSGISFWKDGNSSATNRADAAGMSILACSTTFSTLPRSDTVEIEGLNLDTRTVGLTGECCQCENVASNQSQFPMKETA